MTAIALRTTAEVLPYRARRDAGRSTAAAARTPNPQRVPERCFIIHFAGRDFVTRESMAEMFLRKSGRVVVDGNSALVPLLHEGGVELLLVTPSAVVKITTA